MRAQVLFVFLPLIAVCHSSVAAQEGATPSYVPPPRGIGDIIGHAGADREIPDDCGVRRRERRALEGDRRRRVESTGNTTRQIQFLERQLWNHFLSGNLSDGRALLERWLDRHSSMYRETSVAYALLAKYAALAGDFEAADRAFKKLGKGLSGQTYSSPSELCDGNRWRNSSWCAKSRRKSRSTLEWVKVHEEVARGTVAQSKGLYEEAETHFRDAFEHQLERGFIAGAPRTAYDLSSLLSLRAGNLMRQGRLVEAEIESRKAVLLDQGNRPRRAANLLVLADILYEAGRYSDAERLGGVAVNLYESSCLEPWSIRLALARRAIARALVGQSRWEDALEQFDAILAAVTPVDSALFQRRFAGDIEWGLALLETGRVNQAVQMIQLAHDRSRTRLGEAHAQSAKALAFLAVAHSRQGNQKRALDEFRQAVPILLTAWKERTDQRSFVTTRRQQLRFILEAYLELLDGIRGTPLEGALGSDVVAEMFRIADVARGSAVQEALVANSVRAASDDPVLAELVRRQQDDRSQLGALQNLLLSVLADPAKARKPSVIGNLRGRIEKLRSTHNRLLADIERRFPRYAELISPEPPGVEAVRRYLRPGEVLVSTLVGERRTYVWALRPQGGIDYQSVELSRAKIRRKVERLREALDADAATLGDIPEFEVNLAHELYQAVLEPLKDSWRDAGTLLVVADDALGQLPLSLLPTEPTKLKRGGTLLFSEYREVAWLARTKAVVSLPSAASLVALRRFEARRDNGRRAFVGFGDPWFSAEQATPAPAVEPASLTTRSPRLARRFVPRTRSVTSAELAALPRLPETAEEVRGMASALGADAAADVFLGKRASESQVKSMRLADRRVIAFATHGLVPGDLNGLTQPALALSSPRVTGGREDGLLTMGEILELELNADWVVLSACNTAAGQGAGAEAVSGLGRAFFYAGARSLLVTHWPVETTSAKSLTTEIFKRQAVARSLSRAEALRQSMLALIDGPGYMDPASGKSLFSYAHPIFWAPFALIGDGSG